MRGQGWTRKRELKSGFNSEGENPSFSESRRCKSDGLCLLRAQVHRQELVKESQVLFGLG